MRHRIRSAPRGLRRGFNLVELLIALAITSALLVATLVALDASFKAYQRTTEYASTHTVARLTMNRMLTLIRTGREFGPFPLNPLDSTIKEDYIQFRTPKRYDSGGTQIGGDEIVELRHDPLNERLLITVDGTSYILLDGVVNQYDPPTSDEEADRVKPFTLEYELGRKLYRATIDLTVIPDDNVSTDIDNNSANTSEDQIRLVATAMPRISAY
jgi:prepilin-type N-terminal cleavage/methylation domain-containing protein